MTNHDHDPMLADSLGGELDDDARARFERVLAADPALRRRAETLAAVRDRLASLDPAVAVSAAPAPPASRRWWRSSVVLGQAAVIALAFAGGFLVRGTRAPTPATDVAITRLVEPATSPDTWHDRFARVYTSREGRSALGRTLVAIAQASARE